MIELSSLKQASLQTDQYDFDELTSQLADIANAAIVAPTQHANYYHTAQLASYTRAYEFLLSRPELADFLQQTGKLVLSLSEAEQQCSTSMATLKSYVQLGLIDLADVLTQDNFEIPDGYAYSAKAYKALDTLFGSVVSIESEVVNEQEERSEAELEDELDFEEEINALDILEHLEKHGLTELELTVVEKTMSATPVKLAQLRQQEWQLITLSKQEYDDFVRNFSSLRFKVSGLLREVGVPNKWIEKGKTVKSFQLLYGAAAEKALEVDPRAGLKARFGDSFDSPYLPDRRKSNDKKEVLELSTATSLIEPVSGVTEKMDVVIDLRSDTAPAVVFARKLSAFVKQILRDNQDNKLSTVSRTIAQTLQENGADVSRLEAREALENLVRSEDIFYGPAVRGNTTLLAERPEQPLRRRRMKRQNSVEDVPGIGDITIDDLVLASKVFDTLVGVGHQNKGLQLKILLRDTGLDGDTGGMLINHLVRKGVISRVLAWDKSRSPHSVKKQTTFIKFTNQDTWLRYKADPEQFLKALLADQK